MHSTHSPLITLAVAAMFLAGCATGPNADPRDPFEPFNRGVSQFNRGIDKAALRPAAITYERGLPRLVRTGVTNFFANLGDTWSAINNLLQLKIPEAAQDATRFAFNTVFGLGGTLDIATEAGLERHKEDFGSTLAHWGVPPGPYVVLPLIGPSTLRDALALPVDWIGNPVKYVRPMGDRNALSATRAVDTRATLLPLDALLDGAIDRYTLTRDAYLQHRKALISGGDDAQPDELPFTGQADPVQVREEGE
ncbi:MAG: VacJ family lipoprotein [Ramlibacter sp.]|nr:VacJ family lipoprotein [Ramlibacter sp.]